MVRGLEHLCNAPPHSVVLGEDNLIHSGQCIGVTTKILRSSNNKSVINPQRVIIFFPINPF